LATDFDAEGFLEGLDEEAAASRRELLQRLEDDGFTIDELRRAAREQRLALLPTERNLAGEGKRYTGAELAEEADLPMAFLTALWRALGLAEAPTDDPLYTEQDLEAARAVAETRKAGVPEDGILELARVLGQGSANMASAVANVFGEAFLHPGDSEADVAERYAEASRALLPNLEPLVLHALNVHQREQIRQSVIGSESLASGRIGDTQNVTVAFVDLVGFTRLGEEVPADELGAVAGRLSELASEAAEPPVRLVKMIGDAAMLVSPEEDPSQLIDTALALVAAAEDEGEGFPQLKGGVAWGTALTRAGDWYGRPVNLAARVTGVARPGSVLVEGRAKEASTGDHRWSFAGDRRLKGVQGEVKLFRVRSGEKAEPDSAESG
jgi:adenylate cyclase